MQVDGAVARTGGRTRAGCTDTRGRCPAADQLLLRRRRAAVRPPVPRPAGAALLRLQEERVRCASLLAGRLQQNVKRARLALAAACCCCCGGGSGAAGRSRTGRGILVVLPSAKTSPLLLQIISVVVIVGRLRCRFPPAAVALLRLRLLLVRHAQQRVSVSRCFRIRACRRATATLLPLRRQACSRAGSGAVTSSVAVITGSQSVRCGLNRCRQRSGGRVPCGFSLGAGARGRVEVCKGRRNAGAADGAFYVAPRRLQRCSEGESVREGRDGDRAGVCQGTALQHPT